MAPINAFEAGWLSILAANGELKWQLRNNLGNGG